MKKQGKIDKAAYKRYTKMFEAEKKIHNIYFRARRFTYKQYVERRKEGHSNRELVDAASIYKTDQKKVIWKSYLDYRDKHLGWGKKDTKESTYWGATLDYDPVNELGYHKTLGGLLGSENQVHLLIANRIKAKERKEDVLESYGIIDY